MKFGFTYLGSKNDLAGWVIDAMPPAKVFIDLFAGGCSITHAALNSGKWESVISNDIADTVEMFRDAVEGKYRDCERWVSKEEFDFLKEADVFARTMYSFSCNGTDYMYSKDIEPYKKAMHEVIFSKTPEERRIMLSQMVRELVSYLRKTGLRNEENLQRLEIEQHLIRFDRLKALEGTADLSKLTVSMKDYREVEIPENAIVYADPPYKDMHGYNVEFDHDEFLDWCRNQSVPVFISECAMPSGFRLLKETKYVRKGRQDAATERTERLYCVNYDGNIIHKTAVHMELDFGEDS